MTPLWKRIFWGITLALLAAMWIYGAIYPSHGESQFLFGLLAVCAIVGSSFCLFPKLSMQACQGIGVGLKWTYWLGITVLVGAGIVSFINGAPIPAAIIIGALIIAVAISQSQS